MAKSTSTRRNRRAVRSSSTVRAAKARLSPHTTISVFTSNVPLHPKSTKQATRPTRTFTYINIKRHPSPTNRVRFQETHQQPIPARSVFRLFYFVHVPKTGGVALKKSLQEQCSVMSVSTYSPQSLLLRGESRPKQPAFTRLLSRGHMSVTDVHPSIPTFCILREPYSRVRSAFRFLKEGGKHGEVWECPEREMMELLQSNKIHTISDIFTLRDATLRKRILNHPHMRPQHEFICAKGTTTVLVDNVFVLESGPAHDVANMLHIPRFRLEQRNKSHAPYTLSVQDKRHIRKHYEKDFIVYNRYCRS